VNLNGSYNFQFVEDFIRNGIKQQILWSKRIAKTYYRVAAASNYGTIGRGVGTLGNQDKVERSATVAFRD
jgi:hypothetical protein